MTSLGGAEKLVDTLTRLLINKFEVYIATFDEKGAIPCIQTAAHFYPLGQIKNLPLPLRFISYFNSARRLAVFKKKLSPDLTFSLLWRADLINALTMQKKEKIASLIVINIIGNRSNRLMERYSSIVGVVYRRFHKVLAITPHILEELKSLYDLDPKRLGVFKTFVQPQKRIDFPSENSRKFVFCGRAVHEKNIDGLLHVFSLFSVNHSKFQLVIIGDGPLLCSMISLAEKLGLTVSTDPSSKAQVLFVGSRKNPEFFMLNSHIFLLPSRHEGLPTVLILAAALGLPFLAADCQGGGVRYLLSQVITNPGCSQDNSSDYLAAHLLPIPDPSVPYTLDLWVRAIEQTALDYHYRNELIMLSSDISKIYSIESVKSEWITLANSIVGQ